MPALWSALLSVAIGALLVFASYGDPVLVAAAVVFVQYLLASGPGATDERGRHIPTPLFAAVVLGSITAVLITASPGTLTGARGSGDDGEVFVPGAADLSMLSGVGLGLVVGFFAAVFAQMLRRDDRRDLVRSLSHVVMILVVAVFAVGWIVAARESGGPGEVAIVAAAMAVALLAGLIPRPAEVRGGPAQILAGILMLLPVVAGSGAAIAASVYYDVNVSLPVAAVIGLLVAVFALVGRDVGSSLSQTLRHAGPRWGFTAAFPVALVAPLAFIVMQLHGR